MFSEVVVEILEDVLRVKAFPPFNGETRRGMTVDTN
jgi:hypothetical protein